MKRLALRVVAGLAAVVLAACGAPAADIRPVGSPSAKTYGGAELTEPYTMPDVRLTDSAGQPFALRTGSDKPVVVIFFGYTNCPDICKTTLSDLASALNRVSPEARGKIQVLLITTDPDRDTPEVLKAYLARFDPTFIGLTASLDEIKKVAGSMGVVIEGTTKTADGGYEVTHSTQVIGFDAARKGRLVWTQGTSIGTYKDDFERFVAAQG
ncbi:MAG: SCO family protein [Micropruina sp.]|uniref:SCO family protein n=1 Tax=Micropruina sp. TaxID=2737536 RepID=UPI0039E64999